MSRIVASRTCFPPNYYNQDQLIAAFRDVWGQRHYNVDRLEKFHRNVMVGGRHLALPLEKYAGLKGFGDSNAAWLEAAVDLAEKTVQTLLDSVDARPEEIQLLVSTTVTGIAVPSLEARLMNRIAFRTDTRRMPLFGLGCLGGAAGISRAAEYLRGHPDHAAILIALEFCSLTLQREDLSIANIVSSGLFGDGAAAVLLAGEKHRLYTSTGPVILDNASIFFPNTERVMGWDMVDTGFKVVLDSAVPDFAREHLRPGIAEFLARHGLKVADIGEWVAHPGGPKVIDAMEDGLELGKGRLDLSRESLQKVGNLSSVSVLNILEKTMQRKSRRAGDYGVLLAMGPAFCAEAILYRW